MDSGLRKRPTYDELIGYIEKDIKIKLPNRDATFLRNSPYFTQLDNFVDTDREAKVSNNTIATQQANNNAAASGQTASVTRSQVKTSNTPTTYHYNIGSPLPSDPNVSFQTGGSSSSQGQGAGSFIPPSSTPQDQEITTRLVDANFRTQQDSVQQLMDTSTGSMKRDAPPDEVYTSPKAKAKAGGSSIPIPKEEDDVINVLFPKSKFDAVALNTLSNKNAKLDPSTEPTHWQRESVKNIKDQLILQGHKITKWESDNYTKQDYIAILAHNKPDEALTPRGPKTKPTQNTKGFQVVSTDKQTQEIAALQDKYPGSLKSLHSHVKSGKTVDEALAAYLAKPKPKPKNKNKK